MNEKDFVGNYLWPSEPRLDTKSIHPLPRIEGPNKCGDFIVQCEHEHTFLTSVITKYESDDLGLRQAAGVHNIDMFTGERQGLATRVTVHLPQAESEQRQKVFQSVSDQAKEAGIRLGNVASSQLPAFYGSVLVAESKGINLDIISKLREYAWSSYEILIKETKERIPFDYKPLKELMIFDGARSEHLAYKRMGLSVPEEAQAAVFSVEVSGV